MFLRLVAVRALGAVRGSSQLAPKGAEAADVDRPYFGWALQEDRTNDGACCNVHICLC